MGDDDEPKILVCATFHTYNEILVYRGSVQRMANCGHHVWVAQAGRRALRADSGTYIICLDCCLASYFPPGAEHGMAPGAIEEIEEIAGPAVRRQVEARFRQAFGERHAP